MRRGRPARAQPALLAFAGGRATALKLLSSGLRVITVVSNSRCDDVARIVSPRRATRRELALFSRCVGGIKRFQPSTSHGVVLKGCEPRESRIGSRPAVELPTHSRPERRVSPADWPSQPNRQPLTTRSASRRKWSRRDSNLRRNAEDRRVSLRERGWMWPDSAQFGHPVSKRRASCAQPQRRNANTATDEASLVSGEYAR
jgi:hypothetical protein